MDKIEIAERLKKLKIANSQIERETGFPKNNLGKWLKSPELITDRWMEKFADYLKSKEQEPEIVALKAENAALKAEIARLKPLADSWLLRSSGQQKAAENAPKSIMTVTREVDADAPKHKLWKQGDPPEGSNAFFLRYDCRTYDELQELKKASK